MIQQVIILSGKSGAGKDQTAEFMRAALEATGQKVLVIHNADPLKWILRDYYNWDGNKDITGRQMLQQIGTNKVRANNPDYWAETIGKFITAIAPYDDFDIAIIPDARFPNEIDVICNLIDNVICVRIERTNEDGTPWLNPALTPEQHLHPSETSLDHYPFDYIIHNDEGVELLKESAETVLEDLHLI